MKRLFLLIATALALAINLQAQDSDYVTVGDESSSASVYAPIRFNYNNSYTQTLYLAGELQAGDISIVNYYFNGDAESAPMTLYMAEVSNTMTSFANDSAFVEASNLTQVYSGTFSFQPGWNTIVLDEAFSYSGEGNLVVACLSNRSRYVYKDFKATTFTGKRSIMVYSDGTVMNPATASGLLSGYYSREGLPDVPNTVFYFGAADDFCHGVSNLTVSSIEANSAVVSWNGAEGASQYVLEYKTAEESQWITVEDISEESYTLSDLTSFTNYDVRVYSVCPGANSLPCETAFRTMLPDEAFVALPYEQNFDDAENIDLWQFQNGSNGWWVGTAVNNTVDETGETTTGGALYISNDNGTSNAYTTNSESYSYASILVRFPENAQNILSFDWRCSGESYCDYMKVFLLPVDFDLPTNSLPYSGDLFGNLNGNSAWQTKNVLLADSVAGHAYKLVFAWKNDYSGGTNPPAAIDNLKIIPTTCFTIDEIEVNVSDDGATAAAEITVSDRNEEAQYLVEYRPVGTTEWLSDTQQSPIILNDLQYNALYEMRITPSCGSENAATSQIYRFTTPCTVIGDFPYSEGFEAFVPANGIGNQSAPLCWYNIDGGGVGQYFYYTPYSAFSGTGTLSYSGAYDANPTAAFSDWMISPVFTLTGNERVNFYLKNVSTYSSYPYPKVDIMVFDASSGDMVSASDTSAFTLVETINHNNTSSEYMLYEVNLSAYTGDVRIALAVRNASRSFAIDDFKISEMPSCPEVYDVSAAAVADGQVAVTFSTANGNGSGWVVAYGTAESADAFNPAMPDASQEVDADAELPVIIEGLTPGLVYYFAVQQNCGGEFSEVVSVHLPVVSQLPYFQDFNDITNANEWLTTGNNALNWYVGTATYNAAEGETEGGALYVSSTEGTNNDYSGNSYATVYAYTLLELGPAAAYNISYDYKVGGDYSDYMRVFLVPASEESLNNYEYAISEYIYDVPNWTRAEHTIHAANLPQGIYKLVFMWQNDSYSTYVPAGAIDNISVTALDCYEVVSVTANAVSPATMDELPGVIVDFEDANPEGITYSVRYKASTEEEWTTINDLTREDFPYTIGGLNFASNYTVGVAVLCEQDALTDYVSRSITTPCAPVTAPWAEAFDSDPFNTCWEGKGGTLPESGIVHTSSLNSGNRWYHNTTTALNGITSGKIKQNVFGTYNGWAISPLVYLEAGTTYQISFDVALTRFNTPANAPEPAPDDKFAMLVSLDGGTTWDVANGLVFADGDEDTEHNYSDLTNSISRYVYRLVDADENPISGLVRFAFYGGSTISNGDNDLFIDNVSVEEYSDCQTPYALQVNALSTDANVSFASTSEADTWQYVLVEGESADVTTGTPVTVTAQNLPLVIENLLPETTYSLAIRTVCEESSYSAWTNTVVFTTGIAAAEVPYTCDFEAEGSNGWVLKNGSCTNKWYVGTPTGSTSGNALFVSNNGTGATYTTDGATSIVVAENLIRTGTSDSLTISFDLSVGGEGSYDYLKVFWVPADTVYEASTAGKYYSDREYAANVIMSNASGYYNKFVNLLTGTQTMSVTVPNPSNELKKLVFVWKNDGGGGNGAAPVIDNISIQQAGEVVEPDPCDAPTGLAVSGVTQTGATVTWNGSASSYEVRLNGGAAETVTTTSKTFTDLTAATSYTVEVRSICESGNSAWVSTTFTTLEGEVVVTPPTVATLAATNVTHNGATLNGTITAGSETITAQGFRYKTAAAADWTEVSATGTTISATLSNLTAETAYDFKAFATTATGTVEGTVMTFTTSAAPIEVIAPTVATLAATNVTHNGATLNGTITAGNEAITAQGFRYKTAAAADWTTVNASGTTITATLTDLTAETAYEFKAFATTASGTVEGSVMTFTTAAAPIEVIAPTVTTMAATSVTSDGATLNGTIVAGNEEIAAQGFMYKQDGAADWTTEQVAGENIAHTLTGLSAATTYRFKAFATTASGTVEGAEMSFTTLAGLADVENAAISAVIYPNPASERATLSLNGLNENAQIVLTDVQGRIILTDSLNAGAKTYELNVKSLASGVYYVRVIAGSTIATKKLIVE